MLKEFKIGQWAMVDSGICGVVGGSLLLPTGVSGVIEGGPTPGALKLNGVYIYNPGVFDYTGSLSHNPSLEGIVRDYCFRNGVTRDPADILNTLVPSHRMSKLRRLIEDNYTDTKNKTTEDLAIAVVKKHWDRESMYRNQIRQALTGVKTTIAAGGSPSKGLEVVAEMLENGPISDSLASELIDYLAENYPDSTKLGTDAQAVYVIKKLRETVGIQQSKINRTLGHLRAVECPSQSVADATAFLLGGVS